MTAFSIQRYAVIVLPKSDDKMLGCCEVDWLLADGIGSFLHLKRLLVDSEC